METILVMLSAIFLAIATIGFLLIQQFPENRIRNKNSSNIDLMSSQQQTFRMLETANSYREQAQLKHDHIFIMNRLGVESSKIAKSNGIYLVSLKQSAIYTVNALAASKKIDDKESDKRVKQIENLSEDRLKEVYRAYAEEAAGATCDLHSTIEKHRKGILSLEKKKKFWWGICFASQLLGLFCGLLFIASKTWT